MNKLFSYYNDTYGVFFRLYIGTDTDKMKQAVTKAPIRWGADDFDSFFNNMGQGTAGCTAALRDDSGVFSIFIYIPEVDLSSDRDYIILSHETGHAAHLCLKDRGWEDFENPDVFHSYLYLHDAIYSYFLQEVRSVKKPRKNSKKK